MLTEKNQTAIKERAEIAAIRFCNADCFGGYGCTSCPLGKYRVNFGQFVENPYPGKRGVNKEEIFYLCAACEHGHADETDGDVTLSRDESKCWSCEVFVALAALSA